MIGSIGVDVAIAHIAADTLSFDVVNRSSTSIWLVVDNWFVWRRKRQSITISFARARLRPEKKPFGYFYPDVEELKSGGRKHRDLILSWPLALSALWNEADEVEPEPGEYALTVEVGFGLTPRPLPLPARGSVEDAVLNWQHSVTSQPVKFRLP